MTTKPVDGMDNEFRDWIIDFGDTGDVARYRAEAEKVIILAVRHQKEAGL
jgi:plasmid stabilization system protein ParE